MAIDWQSAPAWAHGVGEITQFAGLWYIGHDKYAAVEAPEVTLFFKKAVFPMRSNVVKFQPRPQQWPETDERIAAIAHNVSTGDHYAQPETPCANKYDRTIIGKYGTGKCTVDVYRVLNAFPTSSPEIDHALKKLLAAGKRGAKDELQDLREAVQSIEARIDYLTELGA